MNSCAVCKIQTKCTRKQASNKRCRFFRKTKVMFAGEGERSYYFNIGNDRVRLGLGWPEDYHHKSDSDDDDGLELTIDNKEYNELYYINECIKAIPYNVYIHGILKDHRLAHYLRNGRIIHCDF